MAQFTNTAQLSYNGLVINSNTAVGEITNAVSATKVAVVPYYRQNGVITYILSIINSSDTPITSVSVSDSLGAYPYEARTVYPLDYISPSIIYYSNGTLMPAPNVTVGPPLVISGITVPANGNVTLVYESSVNSYARLADGSNILNTATITGNGISTPLTVTANAVTDSAPQLTITKNISPSTVIENSPVTYTFTIQNHGNTAVELGDDLIISDNFMPVLSDISVSFNNTAWTSPANYTYDAGTFRTVAGQLSVPAAAYTVDTATGATVISPGVSVLTVRGTV